MAGLKKTENSFSKVQLLTSDKYKNNADLINALLEDKEYTFTEVDKKIDEFKKGMVK